MPIDIQKGFGSLWVANAPSGTVSRIDPSTNTVVATIHVESGPLPGTGYLTVSAGSVWVSASNRDAVSRIDPATNSVTARIAVNAGPEGIVGARGYVWVAEHYGPEGSGGSISKIDPATNTLVATYPVGRTGQDCCGPQAMTVARGDIWIGVPNRGAVLRFDPTTGTVVDRINTFGAPCGGLLASGNSVWVTPGSFLGNCSRWTLRIDARNDEIVGRWAIRDAMAPASAEGAIWIGTLNGLIVQLDPVTGGRVSRTQLHEPVDRLLFANDALWATVPASQPYRGWVYRLEPT